MTFLSETQIMRRWPRGATMPLLSICCVTYNQEQYLPQTIDSFLSQKTTFRFEILLDDDCSTDGTSNIIEEYASRYPAIIKAKKHAENVGAIPNFIGSMGRAKGKYIAICDGDDYWTDAHKLQKQVDVLEASDEYVICITASECFDVEKNVVVEVYPDIESARDFVLHDLLKKNLANTCTVVLRNISAQIPASINEYALADWPVQMVCAQHGKIRYLPEVTARYRLHAAGIWSRTKDIEKLDNTIEMLEGMGRYLGAAYERTVDGSIAELLYSKILLQVDAGADSAEVEDDLRRLNKIKSVGLAKRIVRNFKIVRRKMRSV